MPEKLDLNYGQKLALINACKLVGKETIRVCESADIGIGEIEALTPSERIVDMDNRVYEVGNELVGLSNTLNFLSGMIRRAGKKDEQGTE